MKKILLSILTVTTLSFGAIAQNVTIPDANFKTYLLGNAAINTDADPTEISVVEAAAFTGTINCANQSISDLTGIEAFPNITRLYCNQNSLTVLDVSNNTSLVRLYCTLNSLTTLDVSNNTVLQYLYCYANDLTGLNVSANTSLRFLECYSNDIIALDLSNNSDLRTLDTYQNNLTTLDLSNNGSLTYLNCYGNNLTSLNVANGNNSNVIVFGTMGNPNLNCVTVDDVNYSTTSWTSIDAQTSFSIACPCTVTIPDVNFKAYLVGNTAINTNGDTEIQCSEAIFFSGAIDCSGLSISDLTGIEAFTSLDTLMCWSNSLTSLDLSSNTALTRLLCSNNLLTSLDVTQNTALTTLHCQLNTLGSLDVTQNIALTSLNCSFNTLTNLNVTQNTDLIYLYCSGNSLTSLNVTLNTALQLLKTQTNSLTSLDVSQNIALTYLWCQENALTSIYVSPITGLLNLSCRNNLLPSLDISQNSSLTEIWCNDNLFTTLNVANGNNSNFISFFANNNPNLTCITVDNVNYSTTNWTSIDVGVSFSTNCGAVGIKGEVENRGLSIYPNPAVNNLRIDNENLIITNVSIIDITGKTLNTINGNVSTINVSNLTTGIYFLQVQTENGLMNSKFIKK
jgi:Leucine-rich repeat (LRR) protein